MTLHAFQALGFETDTFAVVEFAAFRCSHWMVEMTCPPNVVRSNWGTEPNHMHCILQTIQSLVSTTSLILKPVQKTWVHSRFANQYLVDIASHRHHKITLSLALLIFMFVIVVRCSNIYSPASWLHSYIPAY